MSDYERARLQELLAEQIGRADRAARRLAWVESGAIARASGGWYAYTRDGAEHHPTLAAAAEALEAKGEHGT